MVYVAPVVKAVPPVKAPYHEIVPPAQPLAESVTVPVPQRLAPALVGAVGIALTVTVAVEVVEQSLVPPIIHSVKLSILSPVKVFAPARNTYRISFPITFGAGVAARIPSPVLFNTLLW